MLIRFKVSNFLSFSELQEFTMLAGNVKKREEHIIDTGNIKLLKFAAIYGANASGKSNLLKALNFMRNIIINGLKINVSNLYCRKRNENKNSISTFDCELRINNKNYSYGFDILLGQNSIRAEWLYELTDKMDIPIYIRKLNEDIEINESYFKNNKNIIDRLNVYASDIQSQDNILFLTVMNKNKDDLYKSTMSEQLKTVKNIYDWFRNVFTVIFPQNGIDNSSFFSSEESLEKINDIISTFGTGISECKIVNSSMEELTSKVPLDIINNIRNNMQIDFFKQVKGNVNAEPKNFLFRINKELYILEMTDSSFINIDVKKVVLKHRNDDGEYLFEEESDGTIRLFDLIEILLNKENKKVYFIDELDRCLHPALTYEFVKRFLIGNKNSNAQLIVTTHESRLLNFDLLRRDEIWFTDREKNGPTHIYSLEDYNERFDKKIDKAYLEGRYGGIPIFETVFPIGDK